MCREGVDVVTGTPARVIDFVESGKLDLSAVRFFVLDEADRLLDTGSSDAILKLWRLFPKQRVGVHRTQVCFEETPLCVRERERYRSLWDDVRSRFRATRGSLFEVGKTGLVSGFQVLKEHT